LYHLSFSFGLISSVLFGTDVTRPKRKGQMIQRPKEKDRRYKGKRKKQMIQRPKEKDR
jgi:Na+/glutamate symporter